MSLILAPAALENLEVSIISGVPRSEILSHLDDRARSDFEQFVPIGQNAQCWAMTETRRAVFRAIHPGDEVMFTTKGTGRFSYIGSVVGQIESEALGNHLWPVVGAKPWKLIYFLNNIEPISVDKTRFVERIGFSKSFQVPGVIRVDRPQANAIQRKFGTFRAYLGSEEWLGSKNESTASIPPPTPAAKVTEEEVPAELAGLLGDIKSLKRDHNHQERAHETLVEAFLEALGYSRFENIKHRHGRIDISLELDGTTKAVIEVKRDWNLASSTRDAVKQAYGYAQEAGAQFVIVTNGDFYQVFDRTKGLSNDSNLVGTFAISSWRSEDQQIVDLLRSLRTAGHSGSTATTSLTSLGEGLADNSRDGFQNSSPSEQDEKSRNARIVIGVLSIMFALIVFWIAF